MAIKSNVGVLDISIFAALVLASLGTGVYHAWKGRNDQTPTNYMLGNRKLSAIPVGLSLMVSFQSAIMMQGLPTEAYLFGSQWLIGIAGDFIISIFIAHTFVPFIHDLKMVSTNEYLEKRYKSKLIRPLVSVIANCGNLMYLGIATFAPAIALEAAFGLPFWTSVISIAVSTIIYTVLGGIKAVVWTDVLQCIVMYGSMIALLIQGTLKAGGASSVLEVLSESGRMDMFDFDPDPTKRHTFWSLFFGTILTGFIDAFDQASFQRISSMPSAKQAKQMFLVASITNTIITIIAIAEGLVIYAYYHNTGCDPYVSKRISNPNQIVPLVWTELFSGIPGLSGLFLAAIVAASLSTLSSILNANSVMIWEDFIKPRIRPLSDNRATLVIKIEATIIGAVSIFLAFLFQNLHGSLSQIAVLLRALFASSHGVYLLGFLCPWANIKGAVVGALTAAAFTCWITFGQLFSSNVRITPPLPLPPVDKCPAYLIFNESTSSPFDLNITHSYHWLNVTSNFDNFGHDQQDLTGLGYLYSLSYRWFLPLNLIIVLIVGSLVSYFTEIQYDEDTIRISKGSVLRSNIFTTAAVGDKNRNVHVYCPEASFRSLLMHLAVKSVKDNIRI